MHCIKLEDFHSHSQRTWQLRMPPSVINVFPGVFRFPPMYFLLGQACNVQAFG